jgi:hypothetical protein
MSNGSTKHPPPPGGGGLTAKKTDNWLQKFYKWLKGLFNENKSDK